MNGKEMGQKVTLCPAAYSYRLSDTHDSMNGEAIHLLSLDMFCEQLQHG